MVDNLRLLARLYLRPVSTMSAIIDEGSLLFGAAAVLAVSLLTASAMSSQVAPAYLAFLPGPATVAPAPGSASPPPRAGEFAPGEEQYDEEDFATRGFKPFAPALLAGGFFAATLTIASLFVLALLYAPFVLLLLTIFESIGS